MDNVKIKGKHATKIIRLINKFGLKEELKDIIKLATEKENKNRKAQVNMIKALGSKKNTKANIEKILVENKEIEKLYTEVEKTNTELVEKVLFLIMGGLEESEAEIFEVVSSVYEIDITELEEMELNDLIAKIKNIIKSPSLQGVFTNMFK